MPQSDERFYRIMRLAKSKPRLPITSGNGYRTGSPTQFAFFKNTEKASNYGGMYGQDIEPVGFYCLEKTQYSSERPGWVFGLALLRSPLVLDLGSVSVSDENNWKRVLNRHYGVTGKKLTNALLRDGFDSIITLDGAETSECVLLNPTQQIQMTTPKLEEIERLAP